MCSLCGTYWLEVADIMIVFKGYFLWRKAPQQKLRTHRSLKAYCANLWWRWRERWLVFSSFLSNGASAKWNWQGKTCHSATVYTTNLKCTDPGSNPVLRLTAWAMERPRLWRLRDLLYCEYKICLFYAVILAILKQGVYAPNMTEGNIVVDGNVASCYAVVDSQWIAKCSYAPLRIYASFMRLFSKSVTSVRSAKSGTSWRAPVSQHSVHHSAVYTVQQHAVQHCSTYKNWTAWHLSSLSLPNVCYGTNVYGWTKTYSFLKKHTGKLFPCMIYKIFPICLCISAWPAASSQRIFLRRQQIVRIDRYNFHLKKNLKVICTYL